MPNDSQAERDWERQQLHERGLMQLAAIVRRACERETPAPRFRLPPVDVLLALDLSDIGERLALNAAAHRLVAQACELPNVPTVLMLDVIMGQWPHLVRRVSLLELGIELADS